MSLIRLLAIVLVIVVDCLELNDGHELALRQSLKSGGVQEVISLTVEFLRESQLSNNVFLRGSQEGFSVQEAFVSVVILGTSEAARKNTSGISTKLGFKHHLHLNAPSKGASLRAWKKTYSTSLGLTSAAAQIVDARLKRDLFIIVRDGAAGQKCKWADTENGLRVNLYALAELERVVTMTEYVSVGPAKARETSVELSRYFEQTARTTPGGRTIQLGSCKVHKKIRAVKERQKRSLAHRHRHSARSGKRALASGILTALQNRVAQIEQKVPQPIRLLTWMTVILLCIVAGALFAFVKVMALAGIDQTWHDCVLQHLVEIVRKEGKQAGFKGSGEYKDDEVGDDQEDQVGIVDRCKASQSVVRGTIRVVSFILVAFYEGNLYNSITISKTGAVSNAVNQLMAASRNPALMEPSSRYLLNGTLDPALSSGRRSQQQQQQQQQQQLDLPSAIQDCLSGSNASHSSGACVGYEFDPRNLPLGNFKYQHKVQKQELWNRLLHSGSMKKTSVRPITSLLQPLAQFCQWVIETGTFHAWNSVEQMVLYRSTNYSAQRIVADDAEDIWRINLANYSTDSLLGMRDYLGLLFIYLFLNLTALVIFGGEITFSCVQARFSKHVVVEGVQGCVRAVLVVGSKFKGVYSVVIKFGRKCFKRKCSCVKVKHFVNNFV